MHLSQFRKSEKWEDWSLLMKTISAVPKLLFFQNNWCVYCIPILWIYRQLKYRHLKVRIEIFILLEIILNSFNVWQDRFNWYPYFRYSATSVYFSWPPLWISMLPDVYILLSLRKKRCTLFSEGTEVHIWQHIHQRD